MKKLLAIIFALALVMSLSVPAFATDYDQDEPLAQTNLTFTKDAPSYTVTIPAKLPLSVGDNNLTISVSATNLDAYKINITIGDPFGDDDFSCSLSSLSGHPGLTYDIYDANNVPITTTAVDMEGFKTVPEGTLLAEFTAIGTKNIKLTVPNTLVEGSPIPYGSFEGYITFGIFWVHN